ncbi:N-acetylmuramoyl-L-alanine amidase [Bacillus cereus]|uniref:N-acetylmuramoyl-L-alanine amidase n=1 Tax=Bacillus cereus group TaxID=86661 RepID=UPI00065B58DB|nr:N-acetylmuramoyl-L-alanine amidase [Bacillus cereus]KMP65229.1 N-acetylmuramoyl-L-alanine amidase [Bacillus cereus]
MTVFSVSNIGGVPFETKIIPASNNNRPQNAMSPKYITVHTTENTEKGADARAHANYLVNGGDGKSWHFTVDSNRIVQHLPINENGWHAGDGNTGTGNRQSIGIETCENSDGNFEKALANVAKLVKFLMGQTGIGIGNVVPHQRWSGKYCPRPILNRTGGFEGFKSMVQGSNGSGGGSTVAPPSGGDDAGTEGLGIVYITGTNVNLRKSPSTSGEFIRKLNSPESYVVWAEQDGWLNVGNSWVYGDPSYTRFARRQTSNVGKLVVVDAEELWVYSSADWNAKEKTVPKGEAFTILEELTVAGSKMYRCKYFYITASPAYVHVK